LIIVLLLLLFQDTRVLVLKNGKKITCSSYEISNGRVTIQQGEQKLTLPEKLINWEMSRQAEARLAKEETAKKEAASAKQKAKKEAAVRHFPKATKRPDKAIVLTNDNFGDQTGRSLASSITIGYRTNANNIIVEATINGQGPFKFVLDTGASVTVISPETVSKLNLEMGRDQTPIVGVSGKVMYAGQVTLDSIAISSARVKDLSAVVRGIGILNQNGVVGLLGQDYLNHFSTHLDPANNTLTLSPHGSGGSGSKSAAEINADFESLGDPFRDLGNVVSEFEGMTLRYLDSNSTQARQRNLKKVKNLSLELSEIRSRIKRARDTVDNAKHNLNGDEKFNANAEEFLACHSKSLLVISKVENQARSLRKAYALTDQRARQNMSQRLINDWQQIAVAANRWNACYK